MGVWLRDVGVTLSGGCRRWRGRGSGLCIAPHSLAVVASPVRHVAACLLALFWPTCSAWHKLLDSLALCITVQVVIPTKDSSRFTCERRNGLIFFGAALCLYLVVFKSGGMVVFSNQNVALSVQNSKCWAFIVPLPHYFKLDTVVLRRMRVLVNGIRNWNLLLLLSLLEIWLCPRQTD